MTERSVSGTEFELLAEIAGLLQKYGPTVFERLASYLSEPGSSGNLVTILAQTAVMSREAESGKGQLVTALDDYKVIETHLANLEVEEPNKAARLQEIRRDVVRKRLFPSSHELLELLKDLGFSSKGRVSRDKVALLLVDTLSRLPIDEIEKELTERRAASRKQDDRSLQGWSDIILSIDRRTDPR